MDQFNKPWPKFFKKITTQGITEFQINLEKSSSGPYQEFF